MSLYFVDETGDLIVEMVENDETTRDANGNQITKEVECFEATRGFLKMPSQPLLKVLIDPNQKETI